MTIEAHQMETWIGTEARDAAGEKVGKIEDIYFHGSDALLAGIRSGLAGRKHSVASLQGASVARDGVQLACGPDAIVSTDGGPPTREQLHTLTTHDERLARLEPDQLEGHKARQERLEAQAEARARADELEKEARRRAEEEQKATAEARDAAAAADDARHERERAEAEMRQVRRDAED
ncbi:MAG: hypothetical protein ACR2GL_07265 [Thermoleophilaceae bacterium]